MARKHFTAQEAAAIVRRLGLPTRGFSAAELARGMDVELEHGSHDPRTDITHDDAVMTAKIALAHLYETHDYYKKLKRARLNPAMARSSSRISSRYRSYDPARARELRLLEQRTSPTQSLAARRARHYGGVGYYGTVRDIARQFPTGALVRVRYGKTTGSGQYDERVWRVTSKGLQASEGRMSWTPYTDEIKRHLGSSLAILSVEQVGRAGPHAAFSNPAGSIDSPERHISHGFYRVSDREAAQLARGVGKPLPKHGYELRVELSDGRLAWLSRTPTQYSLREGPARGWVWAVSGIGGRRSNPTSARSNPAGQQYMLEWGRGEPQHQKMFRDVFEAERAAWDKLQYEPGNEVWITAPPHLQQDARRSHSDVWQPIWHGVDGGGDWIDFRPRLSMGRGYGSRSSVTQRKTRVVALHNPGPHYSRRGRVITFDNGHRYVINEATVRQAARYLAHDVKVAEHEGRRIPTGPQGLTPGAAAVLIHFGRKLLPRRRRRAATRPVTRRAPVARTRPAQVRLPAPAPVAAAPRAIPDFWDRTAEIYGGI